MKEIHHLVSDVHWYIYSNRKRTHQSILVTTYDALKVVATSQQPMNLF